MQATTAASNTIIGISKGGPLRLVGTVVVVVAEGSIVSVLRVQLIIFQIVRSHMHCSQNEYHYSLGQMWCMCMQYK